MARVIIGHLAPAQTVEIEFLCDLAREFRHRGHDCLIWSAIYHRSFAPYYLPQNWRLKEWTKYYSADFLLPKEDTGDLIDLEKWRIRVDQLPKQEWTEPDREPLFQTLVNASRSIIEYFKPDLLLAWNTFCPHTGVAYDLCKELGVPALLIERAVFPHTWFIEPGGLVGKSCIAGVDLADLVPPSERETYRQIGGQYLEALSFETYNRYAQAQESEQMKKLLSPPYAEKRPRIALFPPDDGTLGFWPVEGPDRKATLPYYENSFEAAKRLSLAHDGITIFKPHPSFLEKTFDTTGYPNLFVVDYDFRRVMEWADIVASTGTGLEFVAAGMGKPVLLMANDIFAGKGIAHEAQDPVDLQTAIKRAMNGSDAPDRMDRFQEFVGYLMKDFLVSPRDANPCFRHPADVVRDLCRDYLPAPGKTVTAEEAMPDRGPVLSRHWATKLENETAEVLQTQELTPCEPCTDRGLLFQRLKRSENLHVVLDFDYTLFNNNSTDTFLRNLRPQWLAFFLITLSDAFLKNLARYKLANYERWRDFFRVAVASIFFPWKVLLWKMRAGKRMRDFGNQPLIDAVLAAKPEKVTVISFGFEHLVRPLVNQIPFETAPTLICSKTGLRPFNLRKKGKVHALRPHLLPDRLDNAVFITDSKDDSELLGYIPDSYLVQWGPYYGKPFANLYFPLRYTLEGKYPRRRYLWNQLFKEDFLLLLLAYDLSWGTALALVFLFLSFMTVYDAGYYENDHSAAKKETQPSLSAESAAFKDYPISRCFLWIPLFALLGIALLVPGGGVQPETSALLQSALAETAELHVSTSVWVVAGALWGGALLLLHFLFRTFNRVSTGWRIFLFPFLHTLKTFGYGLLLPIAPLGALLLASQVLIQTITYNIYRHGGKIDTFNRQAYRLEIFAVLLIAVGLSSQDLEGLLSSWRLPLILVWGAFRALERAYGAGFIKGGLKKVWKLAKKSFSPAT